MRASMLPLVLLFACGDDSTPAVDAGPIDSARLDVPRFDAGPDLDSGADVSDAATDDGGQDAGARGYEGWGSDTLGAAGHPDGPEPCTVTHLDDDGAGSLRECVGAAGRLVTFAVGGTITLESNLNIPHSYVTVDGSSAPEPGITIRQPGEIGTTIEARGSLGPVEHVILRYLRMDGMADGDHANAGDIWGLDGESNPVRHIVIDHVTGIASTDGVFDVWADVSDVTISHCLILDTVTALHLSGPDGTRRERLTFHHNLFARNNERQIRMRHHSIDVELVNNVVYGWGWFEGGAAGLHLAYDDGEQNPSANVVGNVFHFVSGLSGDPDDALLFESGGAVGRLWFEDNVWPSGESDVDPTTDRSLDVPAEHSVVRSTPADLADELGGWGTHYPTDDERTLLQSVRDAL